MIERKDLPSIISITDSQIDSINQNLEESSRRSVIYKAALNRVGCSHCEKDSASSRILPVGNVFSPIMFISGETSPEDLRYGAPFSDTNGAIFHVLMEKLNISEKEIYMTSLFKCSHSSKDISASLASVVSSLCVEILTVRPKVIVGVGEKVRDLLFTYLEHPGRQLSLEEMRGKAFNLELDDFSFNYIQTYDLSQVIENFNDLSGRFGRDIIVAAKATGLII